MRKKREVNLDMWLWIGAVDVFSSFGSRVLFCGWMFDVKPKGENSSQCHVETFSLK